MKRQTPDLREGGLTRWDALVFTAAAATLAYPTWLAYARYGAETPFRSFAPDAFYYLNVARRSIGVEFFTYDGVHPTNGFHPLWQWLLTALFRLSHLVAPSDQQLLLDYAVCGLLAAIGVGFLAVATSRLIGSRALAVVLTVPGCFELLLSRPMSSTVDFTEAAPWQAVNGMETSLSLVWFGLFACVLLVRPALASWSARRLLSTSVILSLGMLSRLDDVFLFAAFLVAVMLWAGNARPRWQSFLAVSAVPGAVLVAYLAYNLATVHLLLPVSSSMKRDFGALASNLRGALQPLFPTKLFVEPAFEWDALNWRAIQLLGPLLLSVTFLLFALLTKERDGERSTRDERRALSILASYVLAKGGYNLLCVPLFAQGHWYFPLSIASVNLLITFLGGRLLVARAPSLSPDATVMGRPVLRGLGALAATLGLLLALAAYDKVRLLTALGLLAAPGVVMLVFTDRIIVFVRSVSADAWRRAGATLSVIATGAFLLMYGNAVVNQKLNASFGLTNYEFWMARHRIEAELAAIAPSPKLIELDDGIMAYALDLPVMNGFGLATDAGAYPACRALRCMDVAYERGYRIVSSVQYWSYLNEQKRGFRRPTEEREIVESLVGPTSIEPPPGAERFDYRVLLSAVVGRHVVHFLRFEPRR